MSVGGGSLQTREHSYLKSETPRSMWWVLVTLTVNPSILTVLWKAFSKAFQVEAYFNSNGYCASDAQVRRFKLCGGIKEKFDNKVPAKHTASTFILPFFSKLYSLGKKQKYSKTLMLWYRHPLKKGKAWTGWVFLYKCWHFHFTICYFSCVQPSVTQPPNFLVYVYSCSVNCSTETST